MIRLLLNVIILTCNTDLCTVLSLNLTSRLSSNWAFTPIHILAINIRNDPLCGDLTTDTSQTEPVTVTSCAYNCSIHVFICSFY